MGSRADIFLARPEQEDEQRLREVVCERRGVGVRCHDPPHDEAACPCLRPFHTVSEGEFSEVQVWWEADTSIGRPTAHFTRAPQTVRRSTICLTTSSCRATR